MKIKIISWNVRGVNDSDKRNVIKNLIRSNRADLVCLPETKVQEMKIDMVRSLGMGRFLSWTALNTEGSARGILLFWDKRRISMVDSMVGNYSVSCLFKTVEDGFQWVFTGVYGPVENNLREIFWEELGSIRGLWEDPWCVGGDFNAISIQKKDLKGAGLTIP